MILLIHRLRGKRTKRSRLLMLQDGNDVVDEILFLSNRSTVIMFLIVLLVFCISRLPLTIILIAFDDNSLAYHESEVIIAFHFALLDVMSPLILTWRHRKIYKKGLLCCFHLDEAKGKASLAEVERAKVKYESRKSGIKTKFWRRFDEITGAIPFVQDAADESRTTEEPKYTKATTTKRSGALFENRASGLSQNTSAQEPRLSSTPTESSVKLDVEASIHFTRATKLSENISPSAGAQESRSSSVSSAESNREVDLEAADSPVTSDDSNRCHPAYPVLLNSPTKNVVLTVSGQRMIFIKKDSTSGRMNQEGGSLVLSSYGISLTIPTGAITTTTSLDVTLSLYVSDKATSLEGRTAHVGLIELLPHKTAFRKRVILRYKLRHHYKPVDDCIETEYGLFYGEGIDPSETYDFIGSLGTERFQSRHISYKGTMDVHLRDHCLELSTKTFCRFCAIVAAGSFQVAIGFFVRPKSVYNGERGWDIRITISCTCSENLEKIQEELKTDIIRKFSHVDKKRLHCKGLSFYGRQRLEFSLSKNDDFTSKFTLRSKKEFSGDDLRCLVENDDRLPSYLDKDCSITCPEEVNCTQPVTVVYHYYESPPPFFQEKLVSWDEVSVWLRDDAMFDYGSCNSDAFSNDTSQTTKSSSGVDEFVSSRDASSEAESLNKSSIFDVKVQACESSSHTTDQHSESELVNIEREPTTEELRNVAARIVKEWKHVARALSVDENEIERIDSNYKDVKEQAYQMLLHWMESKSESATIERLCQALRGERKNKTVTDVFGNVPD
ncbi:uncharacterized protein [Oscarella lobularis]